MSEQPPQSSPDVTSDASADAEDLRAAGALARSFLDLLEHVRRDPQLRALVRAVGEQLVAWSEPPADSRSPEGDAARAEEPVASRSAGAPVEARAGEVADERAAGPVADPVAGTAQAAAPEVSLAARMDEVLSRREAERERLAATTTEEPARRPPEREEAPQRAPEDGRDHLRALCAQARVLAVASRWVGERQRRIADGADWQNEIAPGDRDVQERVAEVGAQAWMCRADAPVPAEPLIWDRLAGCYEALADALDYVALLLEQEEREDELEEAFQLLAEAQSAVRLLVAALDERTDDVQREAFYWLRRQTDRRRIYVPRFMRLNDPAEPADWGELRERIEAKESALREAAEQERLRRKQWGRLRYHMGRIAKRTAAAGAAGGAAGEAAGEAAADPEILADWSKAMEAVDRLVGAGLAPSSVELRDVLAPHVDGLPDEVEPGKHALLALREIDRYLASREAAAEAERGAADAPEERSPEEEQVRALLAGKAMVLIGGHRRPRHVAALRRAFGLRELVWLDGGTTSYTHFEAPIAREDVAVVVLMIRWSSHGYGEIKSFCDAYDKPLVRLPAGYNSRQVAHQVLEQAGERLGGG